MINVVFVVPYPALEEKVKMLAERYYSKEKINFREIVVKPENVNRVTPGDDCDVLIARGYAATKLKKFFPKIPVVKVPITGYDVLRAMQECKEIYHPNRIGYVGPHEIPVDAEDLSRALGCDIRVYYSDTVKEVNKALVQAMTDKCGGVVGGNTMQFCAQRFEIPAVIIKTGDEAIIHAMDEAIRTVETLRTKRERSGVFRTMVQSAREGILYVNAESQITVANPVARRCFPELPDPLRGCSIVKIMPFLSDNCRKVLQSGKEILNQLQIIENATISINCVPVRANREIMGVLIHFQNINEIQQTENQIRKLLKEEMQDDSGDIRKISADAEKEVIMKILQEKNYNRNETAHQLGIDRTTLWRKMNRYGIAMQKEESK